MTQWAKDVSPANALPEYPRPQMVRPQWLNLNGLWDYAVTARSAEQRPGAWDGKILVPFPIESALSGVMKPLRPDRRLWYRREFSLPPDWAPKRVLLHFGAVDWETTVWVNGRPLGRHLGGYDGPVGGKWFSYRWEKTNRARGRLCIDPFHIDSQGRV